MTAASFPATSPSSPRLTCPDPRCTGTYACEACLNEHLKAVHAVRYRDVLGEAPEGWTDFCGLHVGYTAPML